jgi:uncharacterized membrane protein YjjB (DUF3815 family)
MIIQTIVAFFATVSFCILFSVPMKQYLFCGFTGAVAWLCYLLISLRFSSVIATFVAAVILTAFSRIFAIRRRVPVTVFLTAGIFPLVPGAGIYYTTYYLIMNQQGLAASKGIETIKLAVAIALGIMSIFAIPQKLLSWIAFLPKRKANLNPQDKVD